MKIIHNTNFLVICPRSQTCRNNHEYRNSLKLCDHYLPHEAWGACNCELCGRELHSACIPTDKE
jgi:hypothetical protein